ncbi:MAG: heme o synthase [Gammaproteobacteria bacterium]|nr:MAG: heme o synthase [Gammaproteobacteria bacterium]
MRREVRGLVVSENSMNHMAVSRVWQNYLELTKPKVVLLIVFTAIVGMFLSVPGVVPWQPLIFGSLGIGLAASSAAVINHILDQRADALMARTEQRPIPTGYIDNVQAGVFALILGSLAMLILVGFVNLLTAGLTLLSLIGYAVIYTMYLKRATPQNIVIGGAAGAAPPILGWTAVTGDLHPHALLLFLIIFVWTPPHFWALAIHRYEDYAKADIPMLPVTHGLPFTRLQILFYTILLLVVSVLPFAVRMSGYLYLTGALALGGVFLYYAIAMMVSNDQRLPITTFGYSILYLIGLFVFLLADHYVLQIVKLIGG